MKQIKDQVAPWEIVVFAIIISIFAVSILGLLSL